MKPKIQWRHLFADLTIPRLWVAPISRRADCLQVWGEVLDHRGGCLQDRLRHSLGQQGLVFYCPPEQSGRISSRLLIHSLNYSRCPPVHRVHYNVIRTKLSVLKLEMKFIFVHYFFTYLYWLSAVYLYGVSTLNNIKNNRKRRDKMLSSLNYIIERVLGRIWAMPRNEYVFSHMPTFFEDDMSRFSNII